MIEKAVNAAIKAGNAILEIYQQDFEVEFKNDQSPLTLADKKSHEIIVKNLENTYPILSEEGKDIPYLQRRNWKKFWMIDPLDGTKEFIKKNGEFTVNIALIENSFPIEGIIYAPVLKELFFTFNKQAYKTNITDEITDLNQLIEQSKKLPLNQNNNAYVVVGSRSHMSEETMEYINGIKNQVGEIEIQSKGSSLKLCMVAEGIARQYPRFAPTMEWDTAAGQAIVEASGAEVLNWETKKRMEYNKPNLLNSWFLVKR
ncbi:MAG: 3'(2'),5'-bisphosphate nucleotidase CysQ [Vicingaceae bacterium]